MLYKTYFRAFSFRFFYFRASCLRERRLASFGRFHANKIARKNKLLKNRNLESHIWQNTKQSNPSVQAILRALFLCERALTLHFSF